jgi:RNA polymerase sigma factor (TIGR02999 family)
MPEHDITRLLNLAQHGDKAARDVLFQQVYGELHRMAERHARRERSNHTLRATALVNEVYLRLFGANPIAAQDRLHFFALCSRQMRLVLVDYARRHLAAKRGGEATTFVIEDFDAAQEFKPEELLGVHRALEQLEAFDEHLARLVDMKFFAGLTDHETAEALGISFAQVRRDWEFARAWLQSKLHSKLPGKLQSKL